MTPRLPVVGADLGAWGTIINYYLGASHNADGTLKSAAVEAALGGSQTYAAISGADDSTGIAACGKDIGLKAGIYKITAGVTLAVPTIIQGRGMADADY